MPIPDLLTELGNYNDQADAGILEKELFNAFEILIASLPDQQRIIFKMRYQDELSPNEIASKLNLSPKTIRNHIGKALIKLKTPLMLAPLLMIFPPNI